MEDYLYTYFLFSQDVIETTVAVQQINSAGPTGIRWSVLARLEVI